MNFEKWLDRIFKVGLAVSILGACFTLSHSDTGREGATRKEVGSDILVASINLTTATGTAIWSASTTRPDGVMFNNSPFTVWLGTAADSVGVGHTHPNQINGYPVLASSTFRLDGSMSGTIYGTSDASAAAAGTNVRTLNGLVR